MSNILEGEHCCGNLLHEIGGEKMIMESKGPREKDLWGGNVFGKYLCRGNTRNRKILLKRGKYWWEWAIWESTREEKWHWREGTIGEGKNWKEYALYRKFSR